MQHKWYVDENLDSPKLYSFLTEHSFIWESHIVRFGRGSLDEEWVPTICGEKKIILTTDLGRDGKMVPLLREHAGRAVLVSSKFAAGFRFAATLNTLRAGIEKALTNPLIIHLSIDACEATHHHTPLERWRVRVNGSLKPKAPKSKPKP